MTTKAKNAEIANLVKEKAQAKVLAKARDTKGLLVNGQPITAKDLTEAQKNAAVKDALFNLKTYGRQQATELKEECVSNALVYLLEHPEMWDSTKGTFYVSLYSRANLELQAAVKLKRSKCEAQSYSYGSATDGDGEETEFNYTSGEDVAASFEQNDYISAKLETFNTKEREYIKIVMENELQPANSRLKSEDIADLLGFKTYGAFRVWLLRFKEKYSLTEVLKDSVSARAKRYRKAKDGSEVEVIETKHISSKKCAKVWETFYQD